MLLVEDEGFRHNGKVLQVSGRRMNRRHLQVAVVHHWIGNRLNSQAGT